MGGNEQQQGAMFSCVSIEDCIPVYHHLRAMPGIVDPLLRELSARFAALYAEC